MPSSKVATSTITAGTRASHFDHLLFPRLTACTAQERVSLLQRYYGYYRRAIRDALTRRSRKPFQCGGLRGYDQLLAIHQHLSARCAHGAADPYLAELQQRVQNAVEAAAPQAKSVRQAWTFLTQMEHYLAQTPRPAWKPGPEEPTPNSEAVRQELEERVADWDAQAVAGSTTQRLRRKWRTMSRT